jgi:RNA polymerase sigma-70 factor, ECF subfamily
MIQEEPIHAEEWIAASREGDAEAFGKLVELHQRQVYGFILRMTSREDVADDLTQETFVAAWKNLSGYREEGPFLAWLLRIALNKTRSHWRWQSLRNWLSLDYRVSREEGETSLAETLKDTSREADPASAAADPNLEALLKNSLNELPSRQKEILLLRAQGLELTEIAGMLGVAEGTVKATLFAAKKKLQGKLKDIS